MLQPVLRKRRVQPAGVLRLLGRLRRVGLFVLEVSVSPSLGGYSFWNRRRPQRRRLLQYGVLQRVSEANLDSCMDAQGEIRFRCMLVTTEAPIRLSKIHTQRIRWSRKPHVPNLPTHMYICLRLHTTSRCSSNKRANFLKIPAQGDRALRLPRRLHRTSVRAIVLPKRLQWPWTVPLNGRGCRGGRRKQAYPRRVLRGLGRRHDIRERKHCGNILCFRRKTGDVVLVRQLVLSVVCAHPQTLF